MSLDYMTIIFKSHFSLIYTICNAIFGICIDCIHLLVEVNKHKIYMASKKLSIVKKSLPKDGSARVAVLDSEQ